MHLHAQQGEEEREREREREAWLHPRNSNIYLSTTWHSVRRVGLQLQPLLAIFTPSFNCATIFSDMRVYASHCVMTLAFGCEADNQTKSRFIGISSWSVLKHFTNPPYVFSLLA